MSFGHLSPPHVVGRAVWAKAVASQAHEYRRPECPIGDIIIVQELGGGEKAGEQGRLHSGLLVCDEMHFATKVACAAEYITLIHRPDQCPVLTIL